MKIPDDAKRPALDAIGNAKTLAQIGMVKATGGVAMYVAHIRQMDHQAGFRPKKVKHCALERAI